MLGLGAIIFAVLALRQRAAEVAALATASAGPVTPGAAGLSPDEIALVERELHELES